MRKQYEYPLVLSHLILKYFSCNELQNPSPTPVAFVGKASFVKLQGYEKRNNFEVAFHFKTYSEDGLLMYHDFRDGYVKVIFLNSFHD